MTIMSEYPRVAMWHPIRRSEQPSVRFEEHTVTTSMTSSDPVTAVT
jgi:hypothetical protein